MWEEYCAKADTIGPDGVKELENQLALFQQYCNQKKALNDLPKRMLAKRIPEGIYKWLIEIMKAVSIEDSRLTTCRHHDTINMSSHIN